MMHKQFGENCSLYEKFLTGVSPDTKLTAQCIYVLTCSIQGKGGVLSACATRDIEKLGDIGSG